MAWRTKSVEQSIADTDEPSTRLHKDLTWWDLTVFGVSVVIVRASSPSPRPPRATSPGRPSRCRSSSPRSHAAGRALLRGVRLHLPVAGSAYTFSYATFGEFIAWIIGWDLILEFAVAAAVVAKGWSSYLGTVFGFGGGTTELAGLQLDWGALLIIAFVTTILAWGTKLSAEVSLVITVIKVSVVLLVVAVGAFYIKSANYTPFIPPGESGGDRYQSLLSLITGAEGSNYGWYRCWRARRSCSSRSSASTSPPPPPRRPKTRSAIPRGILGSWHRHRALRRGGRRADRHGALHRPQGRGEPRDGVLRERRALGGQGDLDRRLRG